MSAWDIYQQWRSDWDQGTDECFKAYCEAVDKAASYAELKEIVGRGLSDHALTTSALKLVILRARQVKDLNHWSPSP